MSGGMSKMGEIEEALNNQVNMEGRKFDSGKPRWCLMRWEQLIEVVKVLTYGSNKYDDNNWMKVPNGRERYFDAGMRHATDWWKGEKLDHESGLHHLAHAICCFLFAMWFDKGDTK